MKAQLGVGAGDSGSPVWQDLGSNNARLMGILHSKTFDTPVQAIFSDTFGMAMDFYGAWNDTLGTYTHLFIFF